MTVENFATTFFIVLGAYLIALLAFSVFKYVNKRKDMKREKQDKEHKDKEDN